MWRTDATPHPTDHRSYARYALAVFCQIQIHALSNLVVAPRQQVPVDIEGRLDFRVAHELLNRLRIGAGVNQQRGEGVPALVERDRPQQDSFSALRLRKPRSHLLRNFQARFARPSTVDAKKASSSVRPNKRSSPLRPV